MPFVHAVQTGYTVCIYDHYKTVVPNTMLANNNDSMDVHWLQRHASFIHQVFTEG